MKKILFTLSTILLLTLSNTHAQAIILDFEDLQTRNNFYSMDIENTYQGYNWFPQGSSTGWASATTSQRVSTETVTPVSGTAYGWNWNGPQSIFIDFSTPTDVNSAWFSNLGPDYNSNAFTIQMLGYDSNGNLVDSTGLLDLTWDFQQLNANFKNVYKLELRADDHAWFLVDNIDLSPNSNNSHAVPEPATLALLGIGLTGMALRRRKA